jgi:hypothetical protein
MDRLCSGLPNVTRVVEAEDNLPEDESPTWTVRETPVL